MTFICVKCNEETTSNDLTEAWVEVKPKKWKRFFVCGFCYHKIKGKEYDYTPFMRSSFDETLDKRWYCYMEYVKKRMDYIQKNIKIDDLMW